MDKVKKTRGINAHPRRGGAISPQEHGASAAADTSGFPIVGVGASAGGLDAFIELLEHVQPDTGMAFVLVQHLDPTHDSYLTEVLARTSKLPVVQISDGMRVERDHVYVIPANSEVGILKGTLVLFPRPSKRGPHLPIDFFFQALAADQGNQAIGVVLSGTGSDGAQGLRAIKAEDGVAFAQEPSSAKFCGMPEAAIDTGMVDFVLPIPALAQELVGVGRHPFLRARAAELLGAASDRDLNKALVLLRSAVAVDFSEYKSASIRRRIARRMAVHRAPSLEDYLRILQEDGDEVHALFDDILIHVTSFFRNPDAFETLKHAVFPTLLQEKKAGDTIRIWSAGCSTGEEAYSLVIALREYLSENKAEDVHVQLFGSDISELAISRARSGFYPSGIARDVSPERLAKFFAAVDDGYRINKEVREQCAFVKHNLATDPPFSKMDLVSCRNLLIYFGSELQKRALATFHFALSRPGFLLLGNAENIADGSNLFSPAHKEQKIFARSATKSSMRLLAGKKPREVEVARLGTASSARTASPPDLVRRTESLLLQRYVPPGVIVNDRLEILHFLGRTAPYLEPAAGQPQHDLLKMARKGLTAELRIAISQAKREETTVRRTACFDLDGAPRRCELVVMTIASPPSAAEHVFAIMFEEHQVLPATAGRDELAPAADARESVDQRRIAQLEAELEANREHLSAIVAEQQGTNEELFSSNEELMSTNEELQSLNEEVETAKEELQSTNEELSTLNEELRTRNEELNSLNSDLINILGSVEVPIVIVDQARVIRRFTPKARNMLNLLSSDIGRPIDDIRPALAIDKLDQKIADVIESITVYEEEVQAKDGRWYRLQIRPYKRVDNRIDGAVVSIIDIDALKRAVGAAEWARDYARATVEAVHTPLVVLDVEAMIVSSNEAFRVRYGVPPAATVRSLYEVMQGALDIPELREALGRFVGIEGHFQPLLVEREIPRLGRRSLCLTASAVHVPGVQRLILLALEDVTERRQQEAERIRLLADTEAAKASAEDANRTKDQFLATLSHELRTPLSSLLLQTQLLRHGETDPGRLAKACEVIERAVKAQAQLVDDLLDISRIVTGKLAMEQRSVNLASSVKTAVDIMAPIAAKKQVTLVVQQGEDSPVVAGDPARLQQVFLNLLTNAVKFTPANGRVEVRVDSLEDRACVRVTDTGIGIDAQFLPHLFSRFSQESRGQSRTPGGLGLGLAIVRYMIEAHGGTVAAASEGKSKGSQFTVLLPLKKAPHSSMPPPRDSWPPSESTVASVQGVRVLLVEDDPDTREALAEMLGLCGADVCAAESAAQAMALFEPFQPELLVTDISMPDEDGYQLLARIRAMGPARGGDVPALALTSLAGNEDRQRALDAGFHAHLAKPVDMYRLLAELSKLHTRRTRLQQPGSIGEPSRG